MSKRQNLDNYPTMQELTWALLDRLPELAPVSLVIEPCAGDKAITDGIRTRIPTIAFITNDINPACNCWHTSDASIYEADVWARAREFSARYSGYAGPEWTITNPPFKLAHKILPLALEHSSVGVAFLLRLTYMEPAMKRQRRGDWLRDHQDQMVRMIPFGNPRPWFPPYTRQETDSVTPAWFVWLKNWSWKAMGIPAPFQFVHDWLDGEE